MQVGETDLVIQRRSEHKAPQASRHGFTEIMSQEFYLCAINSQHVTSRLLLGDDQ